MIISVCTFRRSRSAPRERGIAIGPSDSDILTIVDDTGTRVHIIQTYELVPVEGCFHASLQPLPGKGEGK